MHHRIEHKSSASGMMPEFQHSWDEFAIKDGESEGFTCLMYAASLNREPKVLRRLVKNVASAPGLKKASFQLGYFDQALKH